MREGIACVWRWAGRGVLGQQRRDQFDVLQRIVGPTGGNGLGAVHGEIGAQGFEKFGFEKITGEKIAATAVTAAAFSVIRHERPRARR